MPQFMHVSAEMAPCAVEYLPALHLTQELSKSAPLTGKNLPAEHLVQLMLEDAPMMAEEKELFTKAVIARFGNTNNIYAITNEQQSPVEFMTAFFYVKGGLAKFIGYFASLYLK
jgi:hypothetical protein